MFKYDVFSRSGNKHANSALQKGKNMKKSPTSDYYAAEDQLYKSACAEDSFGKFLDMWLDVKKAGIKNSTYVRYRNTVENHIKPELGICRTDELCPMKMEEFIQRKLQTGRLDRSGGLSSKTVSDIFTLLRQSLRYAHSHGLSPSCSFENIMIPKKAARPVRALSHAEEKALVSVLLAEFDRSKMGVFLCLYTGIRLGELCALQWRHISFAENTVSIERTMQRIQTVADAGSKTEITVTDPKSSSAVRTIPLPGFVADAIRRFSSLPEAYILSENSNSFVEPRTMQNRFKAYIRTAGIENVNFHVLRHTFATRCIEAAFDVKTLSEILGHSSVKITLDRYVHPSMQQKRDSMDRLRPAVSFIKHCY